MKHTRLPALLLVLTLLLPPLSGCSSAPPPDAREVLTAMTAAAGTLPAGRVYDRRAAPEGKGYLSDTLFSALYGPAARGWLGSDEADADDGGTAMIPDAAVFLSEIPHPGELAVLVCADSDSALSAAGLCRLRLDTLMNTWKDSEYAVWTDRAAVTVVDCCVLMAVVPDPDAVFAAARRALRGR